MYGTPLLMDRYGLALPMGHAAMVCYCGFFYFLCFLNMHKFFIELNLFVDLS